MFYKLFYRADSKSGGKKYQYIEYDDVEHSILRNQYRIDMLSRIGEFLAKHIGKGVRSRR